MAQMIRCQYCGLNQEVPKGVQQCRKCGGDLQSTHPYGKSVFICYSRKDKAFVDRLTADLKQQGVVTWRDVDDIPTQAQVNMNRWQETVEDALEKSSAMLVVLSPDSLESSEVQAEWNEFSSSKRPIYPVIVRPCKVPFRMKIYQVWDLTEDYKKQIQLLAAALGRQPAGVRTPSHPPAAPGSRKKSILAIAGILGAVVLLAGIYLITSIPGKDKSADEFQTSNPQEVNPENFPLPSALEEPTQRIVATTRPQTVPQAASSDLSVLGTELWRKELVGGAKTAPVVGEDGTIYVVTQNGMLTVINPDGDSRWQSILGGASTFGGNSPPVITQDGSVLVVYDGYLKTFAPDGTPVLSLTKLGSITAPPAIGSDGTIYLMSNKSTLWAINPDGSDLWNRELCQVSGGGTWPGPVVSSEGIVYGVCKGRDIYAMDAADGTLLWTYNTNDKMESTPVTGTDGLTYIVSTGGWVFAMNAGGKPVWQASVAGPSNMIQMVDAPAVIGRDGLLYIVPRHGSVYALDPATGKEQWKATIGGQGVGNNPVAVSNQGYVYAKNLLGELFCFTNVGEICWQVSQESESAAFSPPAVGPNGELYLAIGNQLVAYLPEE